MNSGIIVVELIKDGDQGRYNEIYSNFMVHIRHLHSV